MLNVGGLTDLEKLLVKRLEEMRAARGSDEPESTDEQLLAAAHSYVQPRRQAEDAQERQRIAKADEEAPSRLPMWAYLVATFGPFWPFFCMDPLTALRWFAVEAGVLLAIGAGLSLAAHPDDTKRDQIGMIVTYAGAVSAAIAAAVFAMFTK